MFALDLLMNMWECNVLVNTKIFVYFLICILKIYIIIVWFKISMIDEYYVVYNK